MKHWIFREHKNALPEPPGLASRLDITPLTASLLWQRSLGTEPDLEEYLEPRLGRLAALESWPGVRDAALLLAQGLVAGKRLTVWGDYDVDGVTATALVLQVVRHYGFDVGWHLPDRQTEGYGLNRLGIERLAEEGTEILLTVDCGISDVDAIARARQLGLQIIISDHHLPPAILPQAHVLCNPQLQECPCQFLAGVGVAFFLMAAVSNELAKTTGLPKLDMKQTLDLVALGTLADMVPLTAQNRILAKNGLKVIAEAQRPGISELKVVSGYQPLAALGAGQVVFNLAPRINAAGRMAHASLALELLCTPHHDEAARLAKELDALNGQRRQEEEACVEEARLQAEASLDDAALILVGRQWNQGVIGIVASRMVELFHKPCLVLCDDNGVWKGSGRSIRQFHLHDALVQCETSLVGYGGHAMAAGLRVLPENLVQFKEQFLEVAKNQLAHVPTAPIQMLDGEVTFVQASDFTFLKELELMQPFGVGNPEPVFASPPLYVRKYRLFGPKRNHVNLELYDTQSGICLRAKAWKQAETLTSELEGKQIRIAYTPSIDMYNGISNVDLTIRDMEILST